MERFRARVRPQWLALCALFAVVTFARLATAQPDAAVEYQAHSLQHKSAQDVKRLLDEMLVEVPDADVIADTRSNRVLVSGPEKAQQIAKQLIQSVDRPAATQRTQQKPAVKSYHCPKEQLNEVAAALKKKFANDNSVRVATDAASEQLFVLGTSDIQDEVARQLAALGIAVENETPREAPPATEATQSEPAASVTLQSRAEKAAASRRRLTKPTNLFVPLANTDAVPVAKSLSELFGTRFEVVKGSRDEFRIAGVSGEKVDIFVDQNRKGIAIAGPQSMAAQLAGLVRALDSPPQKPGRRVRIVPVRQSDPVKVKQALDAYRDGYRSKAKSNVAPNSNDKSPQPSGGTPGEEQGARDVHRDIQLVMFQEQAPATTEPLPETVEQQPALPPAETDQQMEADRLRELGPDVEIETLPDLDVIVIRGRGRDVEEVSRIIKEIERLSAETVPEIEVYALNHVGSDAVAKLITQIHDDLVGGRQGRVSVIPLIKPNAVLLIGWGEAIKAMKELLGKLDQPVEPETQLKVFRLRHTPAAAASVSVQQFYAARTGLAPQVRVNADVRSNSLIVNAAPRDMQEIEQLLEKLDTGRTESVNQAKIFQLKNSLATELAATLQAAIDAARGGPGAAAGGAKSAALELLTIDPQGEKVLKSGILADVKITPDPQRNTLIVTAPAESMDLLTALIQQLDETPAAVAQIKVFRVVNGDAESLVQMLRSLLPTQTGANVGPALPGSVDERSLAPLRFSIDMRTNSIIATGSPGDLRIIEALLLRLDEKEISQRKNTVYRLKNAPALDVARAVNDFLRSERQVQLAGPGSVNPFQQIEQEVVVVAEPVSNSLIISATQRFFDEIVKVVERLDEQPPQVMIQVLIAEVALNDADEFGIELGLQDSLLFDRSLLGGLVTTTNTVQTSTPAGILTSTEEIIQAATNTPGFLFNGTPLPNLGNSGSEKSLATAGQVAGQGLSNFAVNRVNGDLGFGGLVLSASSESVSVLVRALQESRRMEILSRPQVMTLDNQPAFIQVGERVPRIVASNITTTGGQVNTVELTNVGILLGVTPRISPEGTVVMDIDAEKSEVGPDAEGIPVTVAPEGTIIRSPRIKVTQAQTTISAASGQTVVLGGLITKGTNEIHRKVPWLSDLPLLGRLFRFDSLIARRTELLIIMTPRVVGGPEEAEFIKRQETARMHWCCADVHEVHGDSGLCTDLNCPHCNSSIPVFYPDFNPRGSLPGKPKELLDETLPVLPAPDTPPPPEPMRETSKPSAFRRFTSMLGSDRKEKKEKPTGPTTQVYNGTPRSVPLREKPVAPPSTMYTQTAGYSTIQENSPNHATSLPFEPNGRNGSVDFGPTEQVTTTRTATWEVKTGVGIPEGHFGRGWQTNDDEARTKTIRGPEPMPFTGPEESGQ